MTRPIIPKAMGDTCPLTKSSHTSSARDPHGKVPIITLDGVEHDERPSFEDLSPVQYSSRRSSIASTPPLSDTSGHEEGSCFEEPIYANDQDVQIVPKSDLDESSSGDTDYHPPFQSHWKDGQLYIHSHQARSSAFSEISQQNNSQPASIQTQLIETLQCRDHPEGRRFFPNSAFTEIVNEQTVKKELQKCYRWLDSVTVANLSQTICRQQRPLRKIFALLALVGKVEDIHKFLQEGVSDDVLPLRKFSQPGSMMFRLGLSVGSKDEVQALHCVEEWSISAMLMFEDWQWATLAPCFHGGERKNVHHVDLESRRPLPFINDSRYDIGSETIKGGYSTVFKVDIHPDHHTFRGLQGGKQSFAVKCLTTSDESQFEQEVDMLRKYTDNAHPHLISLLATYKQLEKFYLIFPWADTDLLSYWKDVNPTPNLDHNTVLWVAEQCLGIARGLLGIHHHSTMLVMNHQEGDDIPDRQIQLCGRHGDIKSTNILWFHEEGITETSLERTTSATNIRGVLKITDFGLAEFQKSASMIYKSPSKVAVSAAYRSPECDVRNDGRGGGVGPSHDIWALGCLYLEFVTWLLGGWDLVQKFQKIREGKESDQCYGNHLDGNFFKVTIGDDGEPVAKIKDAVAQFIARLHGHSNCTTYVHQFLHLIQTEMIIIRRKDPELSRIGTGDLTRELLKLLQNCNNLEFALKKVPRAYVTGTTKLIGKSRKIRTF